MEPKVPSEAEGLRPGSVERRFRTRRVRISFSGIKCIFLLTTRFFVAKPKVSNETEWPLRMTEEDEFFSLRELKVLASEESLGIEWA